MALYFVDLRYSQHGHRYGYIFSSLEETINSTAIIISDGEDEQLEEIKKSINEFCVSPNKNMFRSHMYGDTKIVGAGYIHGFEVVILELQCGEQINLE